MSQLLQLLIIHCTATPDGREVTSNDIRLWHLSPVSKGGRGWKQVGYTDLIKLNGTIERLVSNNEDSIVDNWEITNGVTGTNTIARHIVYAGGTDNNKKSQDTRTAQQRETLRKYVLDFIHRFPNVKIAGHNQFTDAKDCPSFDTIQWCRQIGVPEKNIYNPNASSAPTNPISNSSASDNGTFLNSSSFGFIPPLVGLIGVALGAYYFLR